MWLRPIQKLVKYLRCRLLQQYLPAKSRQLLLKKRSILGVGGSPEYVRVTYHKERPI